MPDEGGGNCPAIGKKIGARVDMWDRKSDKGILTWN